MRSYVVSLLIFLGVLPCLARPVCVKEPKATLRAQGDKEATPTWVVGRYMPLNVLKQQGKWLQVEDLDRTQHWVYQAVVAPDTNCAVVKSPTAPLFTGPGESYEKAAPEALDRYTPLKVLSQKGAWIEVEDVTGSKGFIAKEHVWRAPGKLK